MKNMVIVTLTLAVVLLIGCSSGKREAPNTEANDTNIPSTQTVNTEQAPPEPEWIQVTPDVSLMGIARKGLDVSNSTPGMPKYIYQLEVHLKNTGAATIRFDTVLIAFEPGKAKPLSQRITSRAINEQGAVDERKILTIDLKNGDEKDWDAVLLGATTDGLLSMAAGEPVVFSLALQVKGKTIAGPFRATLPDLNSFPILGRSEPAYANKRHGPGVSLKFQ